MLTHQEIKQLLIKVKEPVIEFKEAQNGVPDTLYDMFVFSEQRRGIIILGVTDDGLVLGLEAANIMQLKQNIVNCIEQPDVISHLTHCLSEMLNMMVRIFFTSCSCKFSCT